MCAVKCVQLDVGYINRIVLSGVDMQLQQGESVVILGHNGSGKTTLLRTIFGLQPKLAGSLQVVDLDYPEMSPRSLIGKGARFLGQGTRCFEHLSVADSRLALAIQYGLPGGALSSRSTGVDPRLCIGKLSVGERKLEALTMLSVGSPRLFVLDEPMAGLDGRNKKAVADWVKDRASQGVTFVIAEHQFMDFATVVQRALVIRGGAVSYFGGLKELMSDKELFAEVYL
jgi:ABC-type multidrug transport system ATPase subunit